MTRLKLINYLKELLYDKDNMPYTDKELRPVPSGAINAVAYYTTVGGISIKNLHYKSKRPVFGVSVADIKLLISRLAR